MGRRQQSDTWIHRWSRPLIAGIAGLGALETGYLTAVKLTGGAAACPTAGCEQALSSPYATVWGLPLTLFGFLAYTTMAGLALLPLSLGSGENPWRSWLEEWTWPLLFGGTVAMVVFSGYLMYVLTTEIQVLCLYCLLSALLTVLLLGLTLRGRVWPDWGQLLFLGILISVVALTGTLGVYAQVSPSSTAAAGIAGPPVTQPSGPAEIGLAEHLQRIGAKMYGAYWCPHCHDQKQLFGQAAAAKLTYIECDRAGQNAQPERCQAAGITGYPTWEIKGELFSGTQSLTELAKLSDYPGSEDFQNRLPGYK